MASQVARIIPFWGFSPKVLWAFSSHSRDDFPSISLHPSSFSIPFRVNLPIFLLLFSRFRFSCLFLFFLFLLSTHRRARWATQILHQGTCAHLHHAAVCCEERQALFIRIGPAINPTTFVSFIFYFFFPRFARFADPQPPDSCTPPEDTSMWMGSPPGPSFTAIRKTWATLRPPTRSVFLWSPSRLPSHLCFPLIRAWCT